MIRSPDFAQRNPNRSKIISPQRSSSEPSRMTGSNRWGALDRDWMPAGMLAIVVAATLVILTLFATVLWLSFVDSAPGNPRLIYTAANFSEVFFDARTYGALLNTL